MLVEFQTTHSGGTAEIIEKKSRFIATVIPIKDEEEAICCIDQIRKNHWNATHNCYAYVLGEQFEIQRYSDDGEPSGTAGRPILEVLSNKQLHDTLIVVTRYFGGTLLGTGGLVRAYSQAAQAGLSVSTIITKIHGSKLEINTDYNGLGKIQYILGQQGIPLQHINYGADVSFQIIVPSPEAQRIIAQITEKTNAQARITPAGTSYYASVEGEQIIFES